jgi:hypothetical protein
LPRGCLAGIADNCLLVADRARSYFSILGSEAFVLIVGAFVVVCGIWKRDMLRGGASALAIVSAIGFGWFGAGSYDLWTGSKNFDLTVLAVNANTDKPIPGAIVTFVEPELKNRILADGRTNRDGVVEVTIQRGLSGKSSPVCETATAFFFGVDVKVSAEGFEEIEQPLTEPVAERWNLGDPAPFPIHIRLRPKR